MFGAEQKPSLGPYPFTPEAAQRAQESEERQEIINRIAIGVWLTVLRTPENAAAVADAEVTTLIALAQAKVNEKMTKHPLYCIEPELVKIKIALLAQNWDTLRQVVDEYEASVR